MSLPLMPKGVEHFNNPRRAETHDVVSLPLMPKGVEHSRTRARRTPRSARVPSVDAERR